MSATIEGWQGDVSFEYLNLCHSGSTFQFKEYQNKDIIVNPPDV